MVYFGGKRVDNGSVEDRLRTAVVEGGTNRMAYFPYGLVWGANDSPLICALYLPEPPGAPFRSAERKVLPKGREARPLIYGPNDNDGHDQAKQNANNQLVEKTCFGKDFNPLYVPGSRYERIPCLQECPSL